MFSSALGKWMIFGVTQQLRYVIVRKEKMTGFFIFIFRYCFSGNCAAKEGVSSARN